MNAQILFALGMPVAMIVSGVAVWRSTKKDTTKPEAPTWRDNSLDDWRKERDEQAEIIRQQRPNETALKTGSEEQQETQKRHQRLGG
ncbi:MAG: hypothetical protein ABI577_15480 [bacterium]